MAYRRAHRVTAALGLAGSALANTTAPVLRQSRRHRELRATGQGALSDLARAVRGPLHLRPRRGSLDMDRGNGEHVVIFEPACESNLRA